MDLCIVIPCFNEELVIRKTATEVSRVINNMKTDGTVSKGSILFVDDGSSDSTWKLIEDLHDELGDTVRGIKLSNNRGHQNALWAGYERAVGNCDAAVSIDADLQQDINAIPEMVRKYREGYEIVYGVRNDRGSDSFLKKKTASLFYSLMKKIGDIDIIRNHADFRLLGKKALEALVSHPERNLFIRGMVPSLGFKSTTVYFDCIERFAGQSKYSPSKMMNFAIDGITSFSTKPIRIISAIGILFVVVAIAAFIYLLVSFLCGIAVKGWTSILFSIWLIGGLMLLSIGVIGEYIGKIFLEVKRRPRYFIEKEI